MIHEVFLFLIQFAHEACLQIWNWIDDLKVGKDKRSSWKFSQEIHSESVYAKKDESSERVGVGYSTARRAGGSHETIHNHNGLMELIKLF